MKVRRKKKYSVLISTGHATHEMIRLKSKTMGFAMKMATTKNPDSSVVACFKGHVKPLVLQ